MYFAEKYGYAESDKKIGTAQEPLKQNKATEPKQDGGFFASKYGYADERDLKGILPTKPKEQEEKSDDGFIKESFQSLAGGGLDAVEQYARASRALPGGTETYNLDPNSRSAKAIDWVNKVKQENPDYDLDEKREGLSMWYHEGLRAMVPSIAGGLPGAAAGAAIGTSVGGPVGTFLGGLTGFALGAGGVFGAAEYDSFMEEAQQAGVPEEEAHQMGVLSGLAEGGFEAATDLLQGATLGVGKLATAPAKQALKKGVSELFKMRFGNMLGRSVGGAAIEGTGEAATAATQTQLRKELGMTEMSAMDAAAHAFGPGFMMGLMFTPMVQYSNYQGKKHDAYALAREDTDPEVRRKAAERIGKQLGKFDQRAERYWMKYADEAIKNKEPIRLDMDYDTLNERINNLEDSAKYSPKAKENLEILKDQKDLIDEEENQTNQVETAQEGDFQETPETEDYTQTKTTQTLADFDLGQPIEQEQFAEQNNISGSEMEQTAEQPANIDKDTQPELLGTPQMDEQDSTYTNAPIEDIEASQEPVQGTSLLDVQDEDLEIIDGTEEELGNYNIVGPSKKPGQGYKKLDAAKKRAQKLQEEGAESYLMKNRDGEYLVISDRKYAEAKEEPVPLRKDQVETEIRTEIGNQFDTLQKRGLIEIVDNETDAKGEPIYANGSDKPAGYYENGKVTLISSGIGKGQAYNVFMHEGVHKILDKNPSFSKRKKGLFNEFKNLKDTENIKAAYGVVPKDTPTQNIDEEAFAYFIQNENNRDHSLYRKVVATVKSYLNKLGIPYTKLNDKDIAALAVKQINRDMNKQVSSADRKYSKVAGSDQKQTEYDSNAQTMADVLGQKDNVKRPERPTEQQTPSNPTVGTDNKGFKLTIDKLGKDQGKADIANAFIGYGHTRRNTSTGQYLNDAENQGIPTNENINPDNNTIAFVSVASEGINNDKTIAQAQRVLDAGGYIVMDSKGTGKGQSHSSFNKNGEGAVQDALTEQYGEPQKSKDGYSVYKKRATVSDKKEAPKQPDLTFADKPVQTEKTVSIKNEVEASNTAVTTAGNLGRSIPKEDYKYNQVVAIVEGADNADEVVLFGELNDDQTLPKGLGAWAAQTAIDQRTPVYLFDNKLNKWFTYKKGRQETPETIEAQKREVNRERGAANTGTYELLEGETLPDKPILKQEEIADGFTESIPPRIPTDNTFLYADSKYIDQGNVKQAISSIESQEANIYNEDGIVPLPPSIDDPVNSPQGKQAQLQENSANAIREMRRDFYRSRGDSEVADNIEAEEMDIEYGNDEVNDLPELTPEQVEQLEDDVPGNKKGAANVADILRDYGKINREDGLSVFEQIEKPEGFEKLRTIGGVKREVRDKFFDGKEDADLTPDEAYVVHQATENIRQTNEKIIKGLYNQMLAAKSNAFLNKKWNDMKPHKDYESFRNTLRIVTTRDYIASQLVELSKFYDLSTTTDYFAENTFTNLDSVPNELLDLYEYRDKIRQIAREEELDIETDKEFAYDEQQARQVLFNDNVRYLIRQLGKERALELKPVFKTLFNPKKQKQTINLFRKKIGPLIEKARNNSVSDGEFNAYMFRESEEVQEVNKLLKRNFELEDADITGVVEMATFLRDLQNIPTTEDIDVGIPEDIQHVTEDYSGEPEITKKGKQAQGKKPLMQRKLDRARLASIAHDNIDALIEGMYSWGFKDSRHIKLNAKSPGDALVLMKDTRLLKSVKDQSMSEVYASLNAEQKKQVIRIFRNTVPGADTNLQSLTDEQQNLVRDIAAAVKSENLNYKITKEFRRLSPKDRQDVAEVMLQSLRLIQDIWEKPVFGHGLNAETKEAILDARYDEYTAEHQTDVFEQIPSRHTIAFADNYGTVINFDYRGKQHDVLNLVESTGIASEQEVSNIRKLIYAEDLSTADMDKLTKQVKAWKIALAKRALSTNMFVNDEHLNTLSKKYNLDSRQVKRTYLSSVDNADFYRRLDNLIDDTHLETVKTNKRSKLSVDDEQDVKEVDAQLTNGFDEEQLQAYSSGGRYFGDKRKQLQVKAAQEIKREIRLKGERKAAIEDIKRRNEQQIVLSDIVKKKAELTEHEQALAKTGAIPVEFINEDKQKLYTDIAKTFGAELSVIADTRQDENGREVLGTRSYYQPAKKGEKARFVVNVKDKRPFNAIFSDIVTDHLFNTLKDPEIRRLARRIGRLTGNQEYKDMPVTSGTKRLKVEADSNLYTKPNPIDQYRNVSERMGISDAINTVLSDRSFYNELAQSYEGRKEATALLQGIAEAIGKLDEPVMANRNAAYADTVGALSPESMDEFKQLLLELFVDDEILRRGWQYDQMNSNDVRLYSMGGFYSVQDMQEALAQVKRGGKEATRKLFQDQPSKKVAIMNAIEGWIKKGLDWIKKHKPRGFIDDFLADKESMRLASMVNHGMQEKLEYVKHGVIAKHSEAFNDYTEDELKKLHDRIVRGVVEDENGEIQQVGGLDFEKSEDVEKAISEGISQKVIDAFIDYKKVAQEAYTELKKVYPDLPEAATHYGQSIRWRKDGRYLNEDFDFIIKDELEGSDHYTKEKDRSRTTAQIEEAGHRYRTIHPNELLIDYVYETQKLIQTHKMMNEAMGLGYAKIFTSWDEAKNAGFHEVADKAFQNVFNNQREEVFEISLNGQPYLDESDSRVYFKSRADAEAVAETLDGITAVEGKKQTDKLLVGWALYDNIKGRLEEVAVVNDRAYAEEYAQKLKEAGRPVEIHPRFEQSQKTHVAQVYFEKELAEMLRTVVSPNSFRNAKAFGLSGHNLLQFKHASTAVEFAFSLFHAFTISQEAMASEMGIKQMRAKGFTQKLKASNPFTALKSALSDATDLRVLVHEVMSNPEKMNDQAIVDKFGELLHVDNPDVADIVHNFFKVGGLLKMDRDERHASHYWGQAKYIKNEPALAIVNGKAKIVKGNNNLVDVAQTMIGSVKKTRDDLVKRYPDKKVANMFKTVGFAGLELPSAWLMETGIPKLKMATWMKEYTRQLEIRRDELISGKTSKTAIAHDTMKFVEDRFGEVNWKSQWMNKGVKDALIFMFRSFTWFTGSWKGITKAGVDYGKLGWFKLKGENYELTQKGLWGVNAVVAHFLTAAAITAIYKAVYAFEDEVPDDEETDLLTQLMFPRYDPMDPNARFTVPSYVTEAYKIFHHIGLMGDHTEPWKLISGRFNSFIGNAWEAFDGKSWDGVVVRDSSESIPKQALDSTMHLFDIAPISVSSALSNAARKGFDPATMTFGLMGLTTAPAVSLHSDAVNKAYQLRREQFEGLTVEPGEKRLREKISRATHQFGQGNKEPLKQMLKDGEINKTKYRNAIKRLRYIDGEKNPMYVDELTSAIKGLTIEAAIEVWHYMSDAERKEQRKNILSKYHNVVKRGTRARNEMAQIRRELKVSGIL